MYVYSVVHAGSTLKCSQSVSAESGVQLMPCRSTSYLCGILPGPTINIRVVPTIFIAIITAMMMRQSSVYLGGAAPSRPHTAGGTRGTYSSLLSSTQLRSPLRQTPNTIISNSDLPGSDQTILSEQIFTIFKRHSTFGYSQTGNFPYKMYIRSIYLPTTMSGNEFRT